MRIFQLCTILFFSTSCFAAATDEYLVRFLNKFMQDPNQVIDLLPPKYDASGRPYRPGQHIPLEAKDEGRKTYCGTAEPGESCQPVRLFPTAEISGDSELGYFFGEQRVETKLEGASQALEMTVQTQPWSGDYCDHFLVVHQV